jgi:hypothetical protein
VTSFANWLGGLPLTTRVTFTHCQEHYIAAYTGSVELGGSV